LAMVYLTVTGRAQMVGLAALAQLLTIALAFPLLSRRWGLMGAAFGDIVASVVPMTALLLVSPIIFKLLIKQLLPSIMLPVAAATAAVPIAWGGLAHVSNGGAKLLGEIGLLVVG